MLLAAVSAAAFAVDRYLAFAKGEAELEERIAALQDAKEIYQQASGAFGAATAPTEDLPLKPLVQKAGAEAKVRLNYLSETEKDLGKGVHERSVVARTSDVPHATLVAFLAALEARGDGARIKELRLKPSKTQSGIYQDAECVLARNRYEERSTGKDRK
ncbi:MAG: hypothetical protein L6Q38_04135 [Nitrospira sp.]|nr:hypothetical protein [Nitrospira sp.]